MKKRRCYIYTRVSTSMQVEGYSLEAQKERLRKYADFQEMVIVGAVSVENDAQRLSVIERLLQVFQEALLIAVLNAAAYFSAKRSSSL